MSVNQYHRQDVYTVSVSTYTVWLALSNEKLGRVWDSLGTRPSSSVCEGLVPRLGLGMRLHTSPLELASYITVVSPLDFSGYLAT